ncbi:MAG: hypothetical protein D4R45_00160 [Planctomycetaceae bacterium]|nr:MAG: hypothetical protein D4R45_00160 [Planctomycetaceae bacterium]
MSDESSIITCQNCGEPLEADWKECPVCLTPTSSGVLTCPNCQASIKKNWKICPRCETALSGWKTPPAQESSAAEKGNDSKKEQVFVSMAEDKSMATVGFGLELPIIKGDVLGDRYRIIQPLGAGGFGEVYQVDDLVLNEQMALKIVVAGEGKAQRAAEQILHEFKLRERINDTTYIIKAQDPRPCEHKGLSLVLLPMEFANGKSMRQWLVQNQDIEKRQKAGLELFRQACLGVKAIHDAGLVHLDIKPDNILIVEGKAKIADFGIGRYGASQFANNPDQLLRQGIGTPQYMSPEQFQVARQKDVGPASDIYSLGIVLFELLDGNLPFDGTAIELRDKHLNMQPPRLTEKLGKWMRIADRCLAKNPGERYPDIGRLIADLDRAAKGAILSIDVSCPKCGHINANPDSKVCGKCQASLASLFRPCPVCTRSIRLDIKTCPGCGQAVATYYLLLDRKEQIERLKDEDPVEAIEILEVVLRDGADDYQERAVELIKDLRQKQSKIGSLIAEAEKATASAAPKQAIKAWQKILEIIPRHKVAVEQVQKLESLLKDFRQRWEKAIRLMNEAKFHDADNILQSCVKDIPARNDIRGMLDTCRSRSQKYRDAFDHAETAIRGKLIQKADEQISEALSQAPDSEEALAIAAELSKKLEKTKKLVDQAYRELSGAHFSKVGEKITEIKQLQADNPKTEEIAKELKKTQKEYSKHLKAAVEAETSFALGKALEEAILAQNECPDSKEISDVIASIKEKQFAANAHLEEAKTALEEARFEDVEQHAKKVKELWPELDIKAYSESAIQSATKKYRSKIDDAQRLFDKHDFKKALDACEKALQICPKAATASSLKDRINDVIETKEEHKERIVGISLLIGKGMGALIVAGLILVGLVIGSIFLWNLLFGPAQLVLLIICTILCFSGAAIHSSHAGKSFSEGIISMAIFAGGAIIVFTLLAVLLPFTPRTGFTIGLIVGIITAIFYIIGHFVK